MSASAFSVRPGKVGAGHPETAKAAALMNLPQRANQRLRVLAAVHVSGTIADHELSERFDFKLSSVQPRRLELQEHGLVEDSGERVRTPHGGEAIRWRVTEEGARVMLDPSNAAVRLPKREPKPEAPWVLFGGLTREDLPSDAAELSVEQVEAVWRDVEERLGPLMAAAIVASVRAVVG